MKIPTFGILAIGLLAYSAFAIGAEKSSSGDLRFRIAADVVTLDWNLASSSNETYVIMNLMEGLVEEGPDLKVRPALAEKWDVSADGRTYTFTLKPGVKWSDGRSLKASDFEDSWLRLLDPKTRASYATFLFDVEGAEAFHAGKLPRASVGVKALGPNRLQVKLKNRVPHFLHLTTFWVTFPIRADLIRRHGSQWATPGKIATLGPYLLSSVKKGKAISLKRNPEYFAAASFPDMAENIEVVVEPDDQRARELFEAGKTDFLLNANTQDLLRARGEVKDSGMRVTQYPYLATYYLAFNVKRGVLKETAIRAALASSIDRSLLPSILQGGQVPARSWFPPGIDGHSEEVGLKTSLFEARAALTKGGYGEGQRVLRLKMIVEKFDGAELVAGFLARTLHDKLGVNVEFTYGNSQEYLKDPEAALRLAHWGADYPDAENFLSVFESKSGNNPSNWSSAEFDSLVEKARLTSDNGERLVSVAAAEKILIEKEVVLLPLFYTKNTVLLGRKVRTFQISPLNYLFLKSVTLQTPRPR